MVAITNALNLAHKGVYKDLQSIPPGGSWEESFWVTTKGTDPALHVVGADCKLARLLVMRGD